MADDEESIPLKSSESDVLR
ncbi:unnamed protein product [Lathyrus oleraceus]